MAVHSTSPHPSKLIRSRPLVIAPENQRFSRYTHYLFRYPAKFHPPIVKALIDKYTRPQQTILDPFVGSGTLLVEALTMERHAIGWDVDPVAVAVAKAKVHRYSKTRLRHSADIVLAALRRHQRPDAEYHRRMHIDLAAGRYKRELARLRTFVPDIPNMEHWFRRYVVIDLAHICKAIAKTPIPEAHRRLFKVVFASIIRNASNADPVPVSGLEVTAHMKRRDATGRLINPFVMFFKAIEKAIESTTEFYAASSALCEAPVLQHDATRRRRHCSGTIDAVITSPPYQGAVDYYRRHTLEAYWLKLTISRQDRLTLLDRYLGRLRVPKRDPLLKLGALETALARLWEEKIRHISEERANAFRHYINGMTLVFRALAQLLREGSPAIFVVGNSTWDGSEIPTGELFCEIASDMFVLDEILTYPIKNRYMSYTRHNGADIKIENVLVMRRTNNAAPALIR